ncbi:MAG: hypothetical protein M1814_001929 [Vezdaea aestivalis]|nr:MAG: hypothetical protein M1814_001929 [Vezdaea aestivalis]
MEVQDLIKNGKVGHVAEVIADLSLGEDVLATRGPKARVVNMDLAGGALMDIGIYSITWLFLALPHDRSLGEQRHPEVTSSMKKCATGADEDVAVKLTFISALGTASSSFKGKNDTDRYSSMRPAIRIIGTRGEIHVDGPAYRPTRYRVIPRDEQGLQTETEEMDRPIPGWGLFWEADEVARCIRDGQTESEVMPLEESIAIMKVMDKVRQQQQLVYPERIEFLEYPLDF